MNRPTDTATLYLDDAMLADICPFPLDPMIGENMWASDEPRVHWTAKVALIAFAIASTLLVVTQ